ADPQAYALLIRAEVGLQQGQARTALTSAVSAQEHANTWLGHVIMARIYLELKNPAASSEIDAAIKRQGEATAIMLDEVPTYRYYPQVLFYEGMTQELLKIDKA